MFLLMIRGVDPRSTPRISSGSWSWCRMCGVGL